MEGKKEGRREGGRKGGRKGGREGGRGGWRKEGPRLSHPNISSWKQGATIFSTTR
jgi:hypothetical protein